ncbi:MAG: type 1 glutamine amidotransferase [Deltaproteobacteria bacterium]|nr:type 1 glutamine amidotransferase [Deltaproteobacteria bacterium]MCB9489530.1 type 1 glutamine amidotransferase [Deltaproteobacteria bacterium]
MSLEGKTVFILVEKIYEDLELQYPRVRFLEAGATVKIVGPQEGATYESKHGYPQKADVAAKDVKGSDCDALIIPGGYSPDHMRRTPDMVRVVQEAYDAGKVVAAICHAGWMLCSADIVRGRKVTGFFSIKDDLVHAGGEYVDEECVVDGNLVTSRTPADLPAFTKAILKLLGDGE